MTTSLKAATEVIRFQKWLADDKGKKFDPEVIATALDEQGLLKAPHVRATDEGNRQWWHDHLTAASQVKRPRRDQSS